MCVVGSGFEGKGRRTDGPTESAVQNSISWLLPMCTKQ